MALFVKKDGPAEEESPIISEVQTLRISRKARSFKKFFSTAKKVIAFGKPFHRYLYIALFAIFVETFFELLVPVFIGKAIDNIILLYILQMRLVEVI